MSTPAILFSVYFFIGLLLVTVAVASPGNRKRTKRFRLFAIGGGDGFDAGLLIFIAVLWPIWLVA
jgi:hypothetical protein